MNLQFLIDNNLTLTLAQLKTDRQLMQEIQTQLSVLNLYPSGRWIDGMYGKRTETALIQFCQIMSLTNMQRGAFDRTFAQALLNPNPAEVLLTSARDRTAVFQAFLDAEAGYSADKLAVLDKGIDSSLFNNALPCYAASLKEKPDEVEVMPGGKLLDANHQSRYHPYPPVGQIPSLDLQELSFLHADIQEACLCLGTVVDGEIQTRWLGRNPLNAVQFWSATKPIAVLNLISKLNAQFPHADLDDAIIRAKGNSTGYAVSDLLVDMVTYHSKFANSNALAALFKRFETFSGLERWVKTITGNSTLSFRGEYGQPAFISSPELFEQRLRKVAVNASPLESSGENLVSAYDLTRFMTLLGWHYRLPQAVRLPGAQWDSLETLVRALGMDPARYVDVAIARLGLQSTIKFPVIISKLGFGRSDSRNRTELTYTAFVQFIDQRPKDQGDAAKLRMFALTLRGTKGLNNFNKEACELDARMAAEVTEILRRIVTEELA